jgi:hypothetical protein
MENVQNCDSGADNLTTIYEPILNIILYFGRWNYIYYLDFLANSFEMGLISLLIILAATTRSPQIPFSS